MATVVSKGQLLQVKQQLIESLQGKVGVQGIGIAWDSEGNRCVRVNLAPNVEEEVFEKITNIRREQGIPIQVVETVSDIRLEPTPSPNENRR
jgi:hypothetical protein